jgi:hypothetical protein
VEPAAEDDDRLAARHLAHELDARLDRLATGVAEEDHVEIARRHLGQRLGELDVRLIRRDAGADMRELGHLGPHRRHDARVRVSDRCHRDAGREVQDPAAVLREQPAPLAPIDLEPGVVAEDR